MRSVFVQDDIKKVEVIFRGDIDVGFHDSRGNGKCLYR